MESPKTLIGAVRAFKDPVIATQYFAKLRWPNGVACPRMGCGNADVRFISGKRPRWFCRECEREFTAKVGTIFEDSPIGFDKWLPAIWLITNAKNGISSCEVARSLEVTQKTAWFMLHRIRLAMSTNSFEKLRGPVEADETYIGGQAKFMNAKRRAKVGRSWSERGKVAVMGIVQRSTEERKGKVRAFVVPFVEGGVLKPAIRKHVLAGAEVHTDGGTWYQGLDQDYVHHVIDHAYEYVRDNVHTNSIESFFSVLKRTIKGTYIAPRPQHLQRYIEEQVHRFNEREKNDGERFPVVAKQADGKRLTYRQLISKH